MSNAIIEKLPPNMRAQFRGNQPLAALALIACTTLEAVKPGAVQEIDRLFGHVGGTDWEEKIDGKPLLSFSGKTMAQLRAEHVPESTIEKVRDALERRGIKVEEGKGMPRRDFVPERRDILSDPFQHDTDNAARRMDEAEERKAWAAEVAATAEKLMRATGPASGGEAGADGSAVAGQGSPAPVADSAGDAAPTGPYAGRPLSDFTGKSRDEILATPGITPKIATEIQRELAKAKK